jgi:hypothetical protein
MKTSKPSLNQNESLIKSFLLLLLLIAFLMMMILGSGT